jgi:predicted DCC family thiol-disulfide oxidoreductase YuxK
VTSDTRQREYTVVYDGNCNVCSRIVDVLERRDKDERLEIITSGAAGAAGRFPWIPPAAYSESLQVIRTADSRTWQGAAAVEQLLDVLPKGRLVSWMFSIPFARPVAEKLYRAFAKNRYRLGCKLHS